MTEVENILGYLKFISKFLESSLRGEKSTIDPAEVMATALDIIQWGMSQKSESNSEIRTSISQEIANLGTRVHNKARSLGDDHMKLKSFIKSACALVFLKVGKKSWKTMSVVIKILSSSLNFLDDISFQMEFCNIISMLWEEVSKSGSFCLIPLSDLQDLKSCIFKSLISEIRFSFEKLSGKLSEHSKKCLSRALEFFSQVSPFLKLQYCKLLIDISSCLVQAGSYDDATGCLCESCNLLYPMITLANDAQTFIESSMALLVQSCLMLCFIHMERNEFDKAFAVIHGLDSVNFIKVFQPSLVFARLFVAARSGDIPQAVFHFNELINLKCEYEVLLESIIIIVKSSSGCFCSLVIESCDLVTPCLQTADQIAEIRSYEIQYLLSACDDWNSFGKCIEILDALPREIFDNHSSKRSCSLSRILSSFSEKLIIFKQQEKWDTILETCKKIVGLFSSELEDLIFFELHEAEALLHFKQYDQAFSLCQHSYSRTKSSNIFTIMFQASLYVANEDVNCVHILENSFPDLEYLRDSDSFTSILQCYSICRNSDIDFARKIDIGVKILHFLIGKIVNSSHSLQRMKNDSISHLEIICFFVQDFLFDHIIELRSHECLLDSCIFLTNERYSCRSSDFESIDCILLNTIANFQIKVQSDISRHNLDISVLGSIDEVLWLGDMMWNIAFLLSRQDIFSIEGISVQRRLCLAVRCFRIGEKFYFLLENYSFDTCKKNDLIMCSLASSVATSLEYSRSFCDVSDADMGFGDPKKFFLENKDMVELLVDAKRDCSRILNMPGLDKVEHCSLAQLVPTFALLIDCLLLPLTSDLISIPELIDRFRNLKLSCEEYFKSLLFVFDIPNFPPDVSRSFLGICFQVCLDTNFSTNYEILGALYRKSIDFSSSKEIALERIKEFHQSLICVAEANHSSSFLIEDIDYICSVCYNYGISSLEMGRVNLARDFLNESLSLFDFASEFLKNNWKAKIEVCLSIIVVFLFASIFTISLASYV